MNLSRFRLALVIATLVPLGACAGTSYVSYNNGTEVPESDLSRTVANEVTPEFHRSPPDCVVVRPFGEEGKTTGVGHPVERALTRYLYEKVDRVVGPRERDDAANRLGVDARSTDGMEHILRHFRCDYAVRSAPIGDHGVYALVWAQARVGLQVQLEHGRRGTVMWRARHVATRSDGGLPFSPVAVVVNAFRAARFQGDHEEFDTLIDDAARRILRTFPRVKRVRARSQIGDYKKIAVKYP